MNTLQQLPCTYTILDNGVHEMTMLESSQSGVNIWLSHMTDLMYHLYGHGDQTYASVLLDLREPGMMPVGYATYAVKLWAEEYAPPMIDIAIVYRYGLLHSLATAFSGLTRIEDGVRLFHKGRYEDALTWLVQRTEEVSDD